MSTTTEHDGASTDMYVDGKLVTTGNARRIVQARRPNAKATRERSSGWHSRRTCVVVRDRTPGAPWCHATADTAGEAWFKVARAMVKHDALIAERRRAIGVVLDDLRSASPAEIEAAALRYAAERIRQSPAGWTDQRRQMADELIAMAGAAQDGSSR